MQRKRSKQKIKLHLQILRELTTALRRKQGLDRHRPSTRISECEGYHRAVAKYTDDVHRFLEKHDYRAARKKVKQIEHSVEDLKSCALTHEYFEWEAREYEER